MKTYSARALLEDEAKQVALIHRLIGSLVTWFNGSLIHSFIHWFQLFRSTACHVMPFDFFTFYPVVGFHVHVIFISPPVHFFLFILIFFSCALLFHPHFHFHVISFHFHVIFVSFHVRFISCSCHFSFISCSISFHWFYFNSFQFISISCHFISCRFVFHFMFMSCPCKYRFSSFSLFLFHVVYFF